MKMHRDPLEAWKDDEEITILRRAELEHEEKVAMFGKAAYEAYAKEAEALDLQPFTWRTLTPDGQCRWVRIAQAVLDEARKAGWFK